MEVGGVGKHSGSRWKPSGTTLVNNKLRKKDFFIKLQILLFPVSHREGASSLVAYTYSDSSCQLNIPSYI